MFVIEPEIHVVDKINGEEILQRLEAIGRVCYKSEDKITTGSAQKFISTLIKNGHESVIEHISISVRVVCDRGVSHEIVRHRLASYSQESTRYCNYSESKFGNQLTFIRPAFFNLGSERYKLWELAMESAEKTYLEMISQGVRPEEARSVLPNSLKTEIVMTMNLREWRHFFRLRTAAAAHPQMRQIAKLICTEFKANIPVIFDEFKL